MTDCDEDGDCDEDSNIDIYRHSYYTPSGQLAEINTLSHHSV